MGLCTAGRIEGASRVSAASGLIERIQAAAPNLRGRLLANPSLADLTWFRVGGPAEVLFSPADEEDLAQLLTVLDPSVPVTVIGLGSNLERWRVLPLSSTLNIIDNQRTSGKRHR